MSDLQKAIDLVDKLDRMPFGDVTDALDQIQVHLTAAKRKYESDTAATNLQWITPEQRGVDHRRIS